MKNEKRQKKNCHAVSIFAVVDTDLPGNYIDSFGMTNEK
jgi:hypothetical protein